MVRIIQSLCGLCSQAGQHPPAAQKAPSLHILLSSLWVGAARDSRRAEGPGECWLQTEDDEANWLPACLGDVCGEGGPELYTLGGLPGELWLLYGETGWYPQVDVSPISTCLLWAFWFKVVCVNNHSFFLVSLVHCLVIVSGPLYGRDLPTDWTTNRPTPEIPTGWTCFLQSHLMVQISISLNEHLWQHFVFFILIIS